MRINSQVPPRYSVLIINIVAECLYGVCLKSLFVNAIFRESG